MATRRRLDAELVRRRLASSRTDAQATVASGRVLVNGTIADKPARLVATGDAVVIDGPPARFVGRGGEKLDAALDAFGLDVTGLDALDVGASTGGFTDCLLARGAARVVALDVGHGQLHPRVRDDPRVVVLERTNVRGATPTMIGGLVEVVVADVSFISLTVIIPVLVTLCQPGSSMILLVKPQFEAGRVEVSRTRGVITDPAIHERVRDEVADSLSGAGCDVVAWVESPILGGQGNREWLVLAHRREPSVRTKRLGTAVTAVALVVHHDRTETPGLARSAVGWLCDHGHEAWVVADDAPVADLAELVGERPLARADLVVCLGGDGTMLRAVGLLDGAPVPLLGVNVGVLGYLTEIEAPGLTEALERFLAGPTDGEWWLDERMMLSVTVQGVGSWRALNEAVVEKQDSGHTVRLLARIAGVPFTSYAADGLIVATPTGSTAYALSARGPVVSPKHRAMLLTPVSPHMLFDRTLVLEPSETVEIEVAGFRPAELAVDGQRVATLAEGDVVTCCPAAETARFVRLSAHLFHQILKSKFGLADR